MRTFSRPSAKAVLVAGALAMTLVVGATSGAVAGKLITSKQIKDETIRSRDIRNNSIRNNDIGPGAVSWDKSLDQATKDLIEQLVQSGPQGEPGATGPAGPRGPVGAPGPVGGGLVGSAVYEEDDFDIIDDGTVTGGEPYSGITDDEILLPGPGTYLISAQATFIDPGLMFFDDPDPVNGLDIDDEEEFLALWERGCAGEIGPVCSVSIPFVVPLGAPATVPLHVYALGDGLGCGCDSDPLHARVTVFKLDDDPIPGGALHKSVHHKSALDSKKARALIRELLSNFR